MILKYLSDNLVRLRGPIDVALGTVVTGGTCTAALYHDAKDSFLTGGIAIGISVWPVENPELYTPNQDVAVVERSDGTIHNGGLVTAVDTAAGTITVTTAVSAANAKVGARVMVKLGADVTMTTYGTPVVGTFDWGYSGVIESSHDDIRPGRPVRIEITLSDSGLVLTEFIRATVQAGT